MDELKPAGIADLERLAQVTRSPDPAVVELVRAARAALGRMTGGMDGLWHPDSDEVALIRSALTPFQHIKDAE